MSGPGVAVLVSAGGPFVISALKYNVRSYGLHLLLWRAKRRVKHTQAGSESHSEAQRNLDRLESLINQLLMAGACSIIGLWQSKTLAAPPSTSSLPESRQVKG